MRKLEHFGYDNTLAFLLICCLHYNTFYNTNADAQRFGDPNQCVTAAFLQCILQN